MLGNEHYEEHSVKEYKGLKFGQKFEIKGVEYMIYRINDLENKLTLIAKSRGFCYIDIDEFIHLTKK
ncbi:hypothetical protein [Bacillus bombysepticus]|uniref:hypothetical protein n=1 Tax=Bacillus bombysepticus TaxID=658666 RepID=UPI0030197B95